MIIDYNDFYRLRIDIMKVREDLYRLKLENVYNMNDPNTAMHSSSEEHYFNKEQLTAFRNYVNEVVNDLG